MPEKGASLKSVVLKIHLLFIFLEMNNSQEQTFPIPAQHCITIGQEGSY